MRKKDILGYEWLSKSFIFNSSMKKLDGVDRLTLSANDTLKLFEKLAALVLKVHQIKLTNYGYIGSGIAEWTTFSEFVCDSLEDCTSKLTEYNLIDVAN